MTQQRVSPITVTSQLPAVATLTLQGATGQSANLVDVKTSAGTSVFSVDSTGSLSKLANVTTKGDLLAASAASTLARLAVGNNGENLVADSAASTGLRYQAGNGLAQSIINGGFDIWQRATTSASTGYVTADRWYCAGGNTTYSQETTAANLPTGFRYGMKMLMGATNIPYSIQAIETANAIYLAGQRVVLSYYVSSTSSTNATVRLDYSTTTDDSPTGTYTQLSAVSGYNATQATTTSMTRVYCVYDVPATTKTLRIIIGAATSMTSTNSMTITGVQLEVGSVPTIFRRAGGTIQGELAACQRYYQRKNSTGNGTIFGMGQCQNTTNAYYSIPTPVVFRTAPSFAQSGVNGWTASTGNAGGTIAVFNMSADAVTVGLTGGNSLVAGNASALAGTTSSAYIELSAEL
jgi:hypothetical protein